jgi:hypothetical protein
MWHVTRCNVGTALAWVPHDPKEPTVMLIASDGMHELQAALLLKQFENMGITVRMSRDHT